MSLETHSSAENKTVKFDECKLLNNQIERFAEVMERINTRPQGTHNQQNRPFKPYIHRGRGHRNYPSYDKGHDRGKGNYRYRFMIEAEEDGLLSGPNPEVILIHEDHICG